MRNYSINMPITGYIEILATIMHNNAPSEDEVVDYARLVYRMFKSPG